MRAKFDGVSIASALRPADINIQNISIVESNQTSVDVVVRVNDQDIGKVYGRGGWNIRLAEAAIRCSIQVKRAA